MSFACGQGPDFVSSGPGHQGQCQGISVSHDLVPLPLYHEYEKRPVPESTDDSASAPARHDEEVDVEVSRSRSSSACPSPNPNLQNLVMGLEMKNIFIKNEMNTDSDCDDPMIPGEDSHGHTYGYGPNWDFLLDHHYYRDRTRPGVSSLQELLESSYSGTLLETQEIIPYEQHVLNMLDQDFDTNEDQEAPAPAAVVEMGSISIDTETVEVDADADEDPEHEHDAPTPVQAEAKKAKKPKPKRRYETLEEGLEFLESKVQRLRDRTAARIKFSWKVHDSTKHCQKYREQRSGNSNSNNCTLAPAPAQTGAVTATAYGSGDEHCDLDLDDHSYAATILTQRSESPSVFDHQYQAQNQYQHQHNEVSTTTDTGNHDQNPQAHSQSPSLSLSESYISRQYNRDRSFSQGISAIFKKIFQMESNHSKSNLKFLLIVFYEGSKFTRTNYKSTKEVLEQKRSIRRGTVQRFQVQQHLEQTQIKTENETSGTITYKLDIPITTIGPESPIQTLTQNSKENQKQLKKSKSIKTVAVTVQIPKENSASITNQTGNDNPPICTNCNCSNKNNNNNNNGPFLHCSFESESESCTNSIHLSCLGFKVDGNQATFPPYYCPDHR